jgi:outer membrane protein TolC
VLQAETQLASTRAEVAALRADRARFEHAIAVLVGKAPAEFALPEAPWTMAVPAVPLGLPSTLLERRPDIAAAEREVAAANAQIGIERSAFYPSLTLGSSLGAGGSRIGDLFSASGALWSLGVSLAQTVFDAGATRARVAGAKPRATPPWRVTGRPCSAPSSRWRTSSRRRARSPSKANCAGRPRTQPT